MIAKLIARPSGKKDRDLAGALSTFHRDLTLYIMRADPEALDRLNESSDGSIQAHGSYARNLNKYVEGAGHEEVGLTLTRNLISTEPEAIALELEARLAGAGLSNRYVHHMVLSWRRDEDYENHIEEAAESFLDALGFANCPAVIGEHRDTDNPHIHLMVAPVDATTGEEVARYEYDKTRSQMAAAVLCHRFGWRPEENARYSVRDGMLVRDQHEVLGPANEPAKWPDQRPPSRVEPSKRARHYEEQHSRLSLERIVMTRVPTLLENCQNITELNRHLAELGISLARFGNGAAFFDGSERVKASLANRWSCKKIEAKFGHLPKHVAAECATLADKPALTTQDRRRMHYEDARREFRFRLNATDHAFRNAGFANHRAAAQLRGKLAQISAFPSFENWLRGSRPFDPVDVYATGFGVGAVRPSGQSSDFQSIPNPLRLSLCPDPLRSAHLRITGQPVCVDLGDSFVMFGKLSEREIHHALGTLVSRGQRSLVTIGFSAQERRIAERYAAKNGIEIEHAKTASEAEAIKRAAEIRRPSTKMPPPPQIRNAEKNPAKSPPPHTGPRDTSGDAAAHQGMAQSPPRPGPEPKSPNSQPNTPGVPEISQRQPFEKKKKVDAWQNAVVQNSPDANRLASLVKSDAAALRYAETVLREDQLRKLDDAASSHLAELHRMAARQQGMGY